MSKTIRRVLILMMLFTLLSNLLSGCKDNDVNTEIPGSKPTSEENNAGFIVGELLDTYEFLGKSTSEIGIPTELLQKRYSEYTAYLDGTILGTTDYAIIHTNEEASAESSVAESIWIHVGKVSYDDCRLALIERFGEPLDEGEEPYVEINGGAVTWCSFETENITIRLQKGSAKEYYLACLYQDS